MLLAINQGHNVSGERCSSTVRLSIHLLGMSVILAKWHSQSSSGSTSTSEKQQKHLRSWQDGWSFTCLTLKIGPAYHRYDPCDNLLWANACIPRVSQAHNRPYSSSSLRRVRQPYVNQNWLDVLLSAYNVDAHSTALWDSSKHGTTQGQHRISKTSLKGVTEVSKALEALEALAAWEQHIHSEGEQDISFGTRRLLSK